MDASSKPEPLRLAGFLTVVVGGALVALGSLLDWVKVSLHGGTAGAIPTKGVDVAAGRVMLALGLLMLITIVVLRTGRTRADRRRMAVTLLLLAIGSAALSVIVIVRADAIFHDTGVDRLIRLVGQAGVPHDRAVGLVTAAEQRLGIETRVQPGLYLSLTGAAIGALGGLLSLRWASSGDDEMAPAEPEPLAVQDQS